MANSESVPPVEANPQYETAIVQQPRQRMGPSAPHSSRQPESNSDNPSDDGSTRDPLPSYVGNGRDRTRARTADGRDGLSENVCSLRTSRVQLTAHANVFVERLWRTVKYEEVFLNDYMDVGEAIAGLRRYFQFYNRERSHQALGYRTPEEVYFSRARKACGK